MNFSDDQYNAASSFAHTLIVVDDEPIADLDEAEVPTPLKTPGRRDAVRDSGEAQVGDGISETQQTHPLDAKGLVRSALDLGLVCSVVNPSGDESTVAKRVASASVRADIVSLDWHMNHDDDGELASDIIKEILQSDKAIGGRLRLIAIYTGNKNRNKILGDVAKRLNEAVCLHDNVVEQDGVLTNSTGLRLIWLEKARGNKKLTDAVTETQLPVVLLKEFAMLSKGLLSNVALATMSSMRDTTHHVLSKFSSELDGPFFHHRAMLKNSSDSMDYAVSIVMSTLKSEVDKSQITMKYTTREAIKRRLQENTSKSDYFTLQFLKDEQEKTFHFSLDDVLEIIEQGEEAWPKEILDKAKARNENSSNPKPTKASFKSDFTTLFSTNRDAAKKSMMRFSYLTNSSSSELSKMHRTIHPKLGLGSIIYSDADGYFLCLQATCDSVRGNGLFFFIPLDNSNNNIPDIVVPHSELNNKNNYVGLSVPQRCYTKSRTIDFGIINEVIGHIPVCYDAERKIFHVLDAKGADYRWLANLKYKRALKIAQNMSQEISRVGFDEFEPYRKGNH
ncbi:hypothetical protein IWQ55_000036 [Labrenzia sp. EL_208]|nr:hypothetical protein [Labrenzia sp. EL_132]MBG6226844.1 hypothetical protein [Labrenzia sp. EL_208]